MPESVFCPDCGVAYEGDARFCASCGRPRVDLATYGLPPPPQSAPRVPGWPPSSVGPPPPTASGSTKRQAGTGMLQELRASLSSRLPSRRPPIAAAEGASEPNSAGPAPELGDRPVAVEAGDARADSAIRSTQDLPTLAGSPAGLESPEASPLDTASGATLGGAAEPLPRMTGSTPGASGNAVALTAEMSARPQVFRRRVMRPLGSIVGRRCRPRA